MCAIDETPLEVQPEPLRIKRKIPVSLAIVSYLFFFSGVMCFVAVILILPLLVLSGGGTIGGWAGLYCISGLATGVFWLLVSRGLRRCSRGWRVSALVFIWLGFIAMAFSIVRYLITQKTSDHESAAMFWLDNVFGFIVQVWAYRVLTRPDVRELFGV